MTTLVDCPDLQVVEEDFTAYFIVDNPLRNPQILFDIDNNKVTKYVIYDLWWFKDGERIELKFNELSPIKDMKCELFKQEGIKDYLQQPNGYYLTLKVEEYIRITNFKLALEVIVPKGALIRKGHWWVENDNVLYADRIIPTMNTFDSTYKYNT